MSKTTMTTYLIDVEIDIQIEYTVWGATRGSRNSIGVPEEPDEDAGCEIDQVLWTTLDINKRPVTIDVTEWVNCDKLAEQIMEDI